MKKIILFFALFLASQALYATSCAEYRAKYQCPTGDEKYPIHITFDDGPADTTLKILDTLKRERIPATFFTIAHKVDCPMYKKVYNSASGEHKAEAYKEYQNCLTRVNILKRTIKDGHMVGSHSYEHVRHSSIAPSLMKRYIQQSKTILQPYMTTVPPMFRLPNGDGWFNQKLKPHVMAELEKQGFMHIGWEMSAFDWRKNDQQGDKILATVMKEICTKKKGIILFHDGVHDQNHTGRTFTGDNFAKWVPAMRCVADFKPLTDFRRQLKVK